VDEELKGKGLSLFARIKKKFSVHYTCNVINFVAESVESVVIILNNITRKSSYTPEAQHIELVEGQPVSIRCTVAGGCPAPQVTVKIGSSDITNTFASVVNHTLLPGNGRGLRYIKYQIHLWTIRYIPTAHADQQVLQCSAEVTGLKVVIREILLNIRCKSIFFI